MKKLLILLVIVLASCNEVSFDIITDHPKLKDIEFNIYRDGVYQDTDFLPYYMTAIKKNDVVSVKYDIRVSNWPYNHPECECEKLGENYFRCIQEYVVDGNDFVVGE